MAYKSDEGHMPLHEDDPELEREYRMMAELLIDIYFWQKTQKGTPEDSGDFMH
jgi:hypothetical protein